VARRVVVAPSREAMIPLTPHAGQLLLTFCVLFAIGLAIE
jgi:hypothetical protein